MEAHGQMQSVSLYFSGCTLSTLDVDNSNMTKQLIDDKTSLHIFYISDFLKPMVITISVCQNNIWALLDWYFDIISYIYI